MNDRLIGFPFHPRKWPIPYHWMIFATGAVGVVLSAPGQTIGVSAFTDSLISALAISRTGLSDAYMIGTMGSALLLPLAGAAYDRFGARAIAAASGVLLGLTLFALSQCDAIAAGAARLIGSPESSTVVFVTITLLFLALRFFGQGVMTMASRNMVMKWFCRHRGLVSALMGVVMSVGFAYTPKVFDMLIQAYDWRVAWISVGVIQTIGFTAFALVFFRDNPEECGMLPDGGEEAPANDGAYEPKEPFTLRQAMATPAFWIFNSGICFFAFYGTGFTFHIVSVFEQSGLDRETAMSIFPRTAAISVVCSLFAGYLTDRIKLKYLHAALVFGLFLSAIGLAILAEAPVAGKWLIIIGNGAAGGPFGILMSVTWPRFYGRKHLGKITGVNLALTVFASAIGPAAFARCLSLSGSYGAMAIGSAIVTALLIPISWIARNPNVEPKGA